MTLLSWIGYGLLILIALFLLLLVLLEWQYLGRQGNLLEVGNVNWQIGEYKPKFYQLGASMPPPTTPKNLDVFLIEVRPEVVLLAKIVWRK
jgi:hypothetical protein